ncbi:hypothetical protein CHU98_g2425 [Xylaria longipes]|nr:hypothetical protein CHU98_g2425 [Xylaria longipes]
MSSLNNRLGITMFRGFKAGGFVWSPYVTKLEARLRFGGVSYVAEAGSPRNGPKGKIPYVEISHEAGKKETLGDSTLIINALCENGQLSDLNARLSKAERAHDLALRAMLEDKLSFYQGWERWTQNFYTMRDHVLWPVPWPVRVFVGSMIYRSTVATLHGQGTGRLTAEEIAVSRREIWESCADLLLESQTKTRPAAGEPFWVLGGTEPTEVDATLFGFADVKSFPVLLDYALRIQGRYFPDYEALPV